MSAFDDMADLAKFFGGLFLIAALAAPVVALMAEYFDVLVP